MSDPGWPAGAAAPDRPGAAWLAPLTIALFTVLVGLFLAAEQQKYVVALAVLALAGMLAAERTGASERFARVAAQHGAITAAAGVAGLLVLTALFRSDHFALLMMATVLLYVLACLGLTIQFGYAGVVNFAGAAFFGIGSYTMAVLSRHTAVPHLLALPAAGAMAALVGSVLILPVLRTRGHYAALVTIAFGLLFRTFLEVNDTLGGPQGLKVRGLNIAGRAFNDNIEWFDTEISFYVNYVLFALLLTALALVAVRRLEQSWIGLCMDTVRIDETAAATFGIDIARWKVVAFTLGNFMAGTAGAVYATMLGFIAPNNFTFGDSLIQVSIVLLGGLGNPWGVIPAALIVVVLPEKLQFIQEYRFLLYAVMVVVILLFRPDGMVPRRLRRFGAAPAR